MSGMYCALLAVVLVTVFSSPIPQQGYDLQKPTPSFSFGLEESTTPEVTSLNEIPQIPEDPTQLYEPPPTPKNPTQLYEVPEVTTNPNQKVIPEYPDQEIVPEYPDQEIVPDYPDQEIVPDNSDLDGNSVKPFDPDDQSQQPTMMGMPYNFTWEVEHAESNNIFKHIESSDGVVTTGEYRVLLPDGRLQIVAFMDRGEGFEAQVSFMNSTKNSL